MEKVLRKELPDLLLFLGDGLSEICAIQKQFPDLKILSVQGNCDWMTSEREMLIVPVERKKIFMTHGHRLAVKTDRNLETLKDAAWDSGANIILFGHTHIPYTTYSDTMDIMNPGTIGAVPDPTFGEILADMWNVKTQIRHVTKC